MSSGREKQYGQASHDPPEAFVLQAGSPVAMGSNGEYVYLSPEEKRKFVAKVVEATPDHQARQQRVRDERGSDPRQERPVVYDDLARPRVGFLFIVHVFLSFASRRPRQ